MKAVLYARVSSKEQAREGFSIPAQQKLLREYALNKGIAIEKEFTDIETAKATGRTYFNEMLSFIKNNPSIKIILVEKTDRLYRNIKDWVTLDDLMYELDLEIHYVKENFILSHESRSMEKFMHGIKVLMAKNYIDNLSDEIKKGTMEKVRQGGYPRKPPVGYKNNPETKKTEIDPEKAPYVLELYKLYASGNYSLSALRNKCIKDGFRLKQSEKEMRKSSLFFILNNEFYTGYFKWKGKRYKGNYEPLVNRELFDAVQNQFKSHNKPKFSKKDFTYAGILTCANCNCAITAEIKKGKYIYYHCTNFHDNCNKEYVREEVLDDQFNKLIQSFQYDERIVTWIKVALKSSFEDENEYHTRAVSDLQKSYNRLQDRLEKIYIDKIDGKITEDFWQEKDTAWRETQSDILQKIQAHQRADQSYMLTGIKTIELAQKVAISYSRRLPEEKRMILNILLSNSKLDKDRVILEYRRPFDLIASIRDLKIKKDGEDYSTSPSLNKEWTLLDSNQ